jgi:DNA-binding transcriptional ArsR family regulator
VSITRQVAASLAVEDNNVVASRDGLNIEEDRRVLWAWLLQITFNKLSGRIAYHLAAKRSVVRENELSSLLESAYGQDLALWSKEPSVEDLAAIADELDYLFGPHEATLRRVVDLRLQDFTITEIAERLSVSHTTVGRHLKKIVRRFEDRWRSLLENGSLAEGSTQ